MKHLNFSILILLLVFCSLSNAQTKLTIDINNKGVAVSPTHYGVFFEDINHAADGGLYAELLENRSFEDSNNLKNWAVVPINASNVTATLETKDLLNSSQAKALKLNISNATSNAPVGVFNSGYWGINVVKGQEYTVSFFAKCSNTFTGNVILTLETPGYFKLGKQTVTGLTTEWKKYTCKITANGNNASGIFVLYVDAPGQVWFDVVSLFPPTFMNRPNGCRKDLAQLLLDMKPKFVRFPGGCFVEGDSIHNRFQWKKTIGNIEDRAGHKNIWGYRTTDGMGYLEFLQLTEDLGAEPLYVTNIGVSHTTFQPYNALDEYVQDALDAIEYANGDTTTKWGALRAKHGHPAPFNMKMIEIGNENNWGDNYANRYKIFHNAIKAKYPYITCISNDYANIGEDMRDEHYYNSPDWFVNNYNKYDAYSRTSSKVYTGEYAVTSNCGNGNMRAAVGEAVFMCGMEKNSDVVRMNSYAPVFVNNNNRAWNPDMIVYNASQVYCTPSYYVQNLFSNYLGNVNVNVTDSANQTKVLIDGSGSIGLGSWATQVVYSNVSVVNKNGTSLLTDNFTSNLNWSETKGTWTISGGTYIQSSTSDDCKSINKTQISSKEYTYSLKAKKTGGNEGFLIVFGYKDSNNYYWWNLGGWGNSKHGIEQCIGGGKILVTSATGNIKSNKWYDIRIEVSPEQILCYLDNVLIHKLEPSNAPTLFTSATLNETDNELYVKVVNPQATDVNTLINIKGYSNQRFKGEAITLKSTLSTDENSFAKPNHIQPVVSTVVSEGNILNQVFKSNSVTILKLKDYVDGLSKPISKKSVTVCPNPVSNVLNVNGNISEGTSVKICDTLGRLLLERKIKDGKVDFSTLNSGLYFLTLLQENSQSTVKVYKK
jgi:alpha-L-arabinofuranosidase